MQKLLLDKRQIPSKARALGGIGICIVGIFLTVAADARDVLAQTYDICANGQNSYDETILQFSERGWQTVPSEQLEAVSYLFSGLEGLSIINAVKRPQSAYFQSSTLFTSDTEFAVTNIFHNVRRRLITCQIATTQVEYGALLSRIASVYPGASLQEFQDEQILWEHGQRVPYVSFHVVIPNEPKTFKANVPFTIHTGGAISRFYEVSQ